MTFTVDTKPECCTPNPVALLSIEPGECKFPVGECQPITFTACPLRQDRCQFEIQLVSFDNFGDMTGVTMDSLTTDTCSRENNPSAGVAFAFGFVPRPSQVGITDISCSVSVNIPSGP